MVELVQEVGPELDPELEPKLRKEDHNTCTFHLSVPAVSVCLSCCVFLCLDCQNDTHQQHHLSNFAEAQARICEILQAGKSEFVSLLDALEASSSKLEQQFEELIKHQKRLTNEIRAEYNGLIELVRENQERNPYFPLVAYLIKAHDFHVSQRLSNVSPVLMVNLVQRRDALIRAATVEVDMDIHMLRQKLEETSKCKGLILDLTTAIEVFLQSNSLLSSESAQAKQTTSLQQIVKSFSSIDKQLEHLRLIEPSIQALLQPFEPKSSLVLVQKQT